MFQVTSLCKMLMKCVLLLVNCALLVNCCADGSPEIRITNGVIRGRTFVSPWTNQVVYAFQGIPYATPPTGDLRFKDPISAVNWTGTKDCVQDGASCFQPSILFNQTLNSSQSEDCLFLNVYTPNLHPVTGLPVLIWIHGGAFLLGSGNYLGQGPDKLVAQNIIVVTLNYRLGPFGFLSLGTPETPGNVGLKDQRLAMIWVQDEISKFGGDPTKVTIFGESAGASAVHLHYLSPLSKGLFRGAIGDSGTSLGLNYPVRSTGASVFYSLQLARLLNCSSPTIVTLAYACLMAADADSINQVQFLGDPTPEDKEVGLVVKFMPSIDKQTSNMSILPEFPAILMDQREGSYVPFLMGINKDEGVLGLGGRDKGEKNISAYVEQFIPLEVRKRCSTSELQWLTVKLSEFYFNNTPVSNENIRGLFDINTDANFAHPAVISARKFQERGNVFLYYFTFDGSFKDLYFKVIEEHFNLSLVPHTEELNYIFVNQNINQSKSKTSDEVETWNRMVKMWTNFVVHGSPTVGSDALLQNVDWLPVNQTSTRYLWIDKDLKMVESDLLAERMALWDLVAASGSAFPQPTLVPILCCVTLLLRKT